MFKKPMKVEATAIVAFGSAHELEVSFVQTFAQGTYKDRGRKTLVLVRSATGLLIAHEELRDSSLEKPDPVPPAKDLVGFLDGDGVVLTTELGTGWASGAADLSEHAGRYSTLQKVALGKIPKRFLDQRSGQVEVINSDGTICNATIGELRIASSLTPHFGTVEEWKQKKTPRAEIARELLEQSGPDGDRLVGTLAPVCKDGLVARRAGGTASIARAQALTSGVEYDAALKALRSNAAYAALTKSMKNDEPETLTENHGRWEDAESTHVAAFDLQVSGHAERWLSAYFGRYTGCGSWSGELWALYRVLTLLSKPGEVVIFPSVAVDLDGDGWPELIYKRGSLNDLDLDRGILWRQGDRYRRRLEQKTPYHDCPC